MAEKRVVLTWSGIGTGAAFLSETMVSEATSVIVMIGIRAAFPFEMMVLEAIATIVTNRIEFKSKRLY